MLPRADGPRDALPLNADGKVDRTAPPAPPQDPCVTRLYNGPHGGVESLVAQLWAELLQVQQIGPHDHFFALGGHSLLAVQLVQRMRQVGLRADVRVLFGQPTLAALAAASEYGGMDAPELAALDPESLARIVASIPGGAANVQDVYPLAPLQEGLLYHHITDERDPYQQQALFSFARREQVDAFAQALQQVINRHDILRTSLVWDALEQPMQVVWREALLRFEPLR